VRCSVLIVSYNTCSLTLQAIASVVSEPCVETIVVDNASGDRSADAIAARYPAVHLIRSERNLGFAGGMNAAAAVAEGETLLLLNSDACLAPGALELLLQHMDSQPRAGLVAPALRYADGRWQPSAFAFPGLVQIALDLYPIDRLTDSQLNGRVQADTPRQVDHPLGACMLIRRAAWHDVGPLDQGYFMYLEEIDWCRRARARGWQIWYQPRAIAVHHGGSSTSQQPDAMFAELWRSRLRYYGRFHGPIYNRLVHAVVRLGLRKRSGATERVRQLVA
jgi:N-acetylglucosaminyl-diphospho-decaprenol L-rhamnosyltransferase